MSLPVQHPALGCVIIAWVMSPLLEGAVPLRTQQIPQERAEAGKFPINELQWCSQRWTEKSLCQYSSERKQIHPGLIFLILFLPIKISGKQTGERQIFSGRSRSLNIIALKWLMKDLWKCCSVKRWIYSLICWLYYVEDYYFRTLSPLECFAKIVG